MASNGASPSYPAYPHLRQVLAPQYREATDSQIEALFDYSDISAAEAEEFFSSVGRFFSNAARDVGRALPQIAQVAAPIAQAALPIVGTAIGGPIGGALGGLAATGIGALAGQAQPRPPARPTMPMPGISPASRIPGMPAPQGGAAGQLMQLLGDPRLLQALASMSLGQAGSRTVPVGGTRVNPASLTNLLGVLANQATAEALASENIYGEAPDYVGESLGDPAIANHRAAALFDLLQETYPYPYPHEVTNYEYSSEFKTSGLFDSGMIPYYEQYYEAYFGSDVSQDYLELEFEFSDYTDYENE